MFQYILVQGRNQKVWQTLLCNNQKNYISTFTNVIILPLQRGVHLIIQYVYYCGLQPF